MLMSDPIVTPIPRQTPGQREWQALSRHDGKALSRQWIADLCRAHARLVQPKASSEVKK